MKTSRQNREAAMRLVYGDGPYGARATRWLEDGDDADFESAWQGLTHRDRAEHLVDVAQAFAQEERRIKDKVSAYAAGDVLLIELCADLDLPRPPPNRRHRIALAAESTGGHRVALYDAEDPLGVFVAEDADVGASALARKLKAALDAAADCGYAEEAYYVLRDRVEALSKELES